MPTKVDDSEVLAALYPKQRAAIFEPKRLSLIEASTKAGKTSACIMWLLAKAFGGEERRNYWWVAPVTNQAEIAFNRMRYALKPGTFTAALSHPQRITLSNGATIAFKSGDKPDSLYGEDVWAAVVDEASRMKRDAWIALRSTLTYTQGRGGGHARIIGNVHGRKNWFYELARRAQREQELHPGVGHPEMAYHKMTAYDAIEAGVLTAEAVEDARNEMPEEAWRELFLAEPADDGGNPFGLAHIRACTVGNLTGRMPTSWGWDLAKKQDWTVGCGIDGEGYLCRFERFQGVPWPEVEERIIRAVGSCAVLVDSTGLGDPIVDHLQKEAAGTGAHVEGYHFTPSSKQKLMEGLVFAIQGHSVRFPAGPLTTELEQFEYEFTRTGVRYSAPEGMHDDCVVALALAWQCRTLVPAPLNITERVLADVSAYRWNG